jgi:hypothetical protein
MNGRITVRNSGQFSRSSPFRHDRNGWCRLTAPDTEIKEDGIYSGDGPQLRLSSQPSSKRTYCAERAKR